MSISVKKFEEKDICWSFGAESPVVSVKDGSYSTSVKVDPFPGYAHDASLVQSELEAVAAAFPMPNDVTVCILPREALERTNAWCSIGYDYDHKFPDAKEGRDQYPWIATIVLSAKRIPIHPAMTRYLVAHEYGHAVYKFLSNERGDKGQSENLYQEYAELRGTTNPSHYGGGTWHARIEELFANDFRILVAGRELEFWPHPEHPRPESVEKIKMFWDAARWRVSAK